MNLQKRLLFASLCLAISGFAFYSLFRFDLFGHGYIATENTALKQYSSPFSVLDWFPSFLFVVLMSLFSAGVIGVSKQSAKFIPVSWLVIASLLEALQWLPGNFPLFIGTFDPNDLTASIIGAVVSLFILARCIKRDSIHSPRPLTRVFLLLSGASLSIASTSIEFDVYGHAPVERTYSCTFPDGKVSGCEITPLYLPYSELRGNDTVYFSAENATEVTQPLIDAGAATTEFSGLRVPGKIYVFADYLFIVDQLKGVYMFDNIAPEEPKFLGFINVIGATDIEILNGVMYINSFTDVVAIEMQPPFTMNRSIELFEYPSVDQWVPQGAYFVDIQTGESIDIDRSKGIVVGYENKRGDRFFFWDLEL